MNLTPGTRLGPYEIFGPLGAGGMGRWIAYSSDESGRYEQFVQSFPTPGAKYQVTSGGAINLTVRWTKNGKELMFLGGDSFTAYDFAEDAERVLVCAPAGSPQPASITIDVNWTSQLAK